MRAGSSTGNGGLEADSPTGTGRLEAGSSSGNDDREVGASSTGQHDLMQPGMVHTAGLFLPLHEMLIGLLRGLPGGAWTVPVGHGAWMVRDVVAHLLDGDLRRISIDRDGHAPPPPADPIGSHGDLVRYLDALNAEWTIAARRLSTPLLVELLDGSGRTVGALMEAARPDGEATYAVTWAGQARSPMWLDIGREYTERWHHQDQIREAVGAEPVTDPVLLRAVLEVSLFAIPAALAGVARPDGTTVSIVATGPAGGRCDMVRQDGQWRVGGAAASAAVRLTATDLNLARLLMHRLSADRIADLVEVEGDTGLAAAIMGARAVMV